MNAIRKIVLIIFTFFYLFNPTNFANFNLYYILIASSTIYCIIHSRDFNKILSSKPLFYFILFNLYLIIYIIFISAANNGNGYARAYTTLLLISIIPCAFFIVREFCFIYNCTIHSLIKFISIVVFIQLLFVIATLVIPELRTVILATSRNQELLSISNDYGGIRSFGLANGYTSTFPMLMGLFALFHLYCFVLNKKIFSYFTHALLVLLLTLSVVLNARIGLVPIGLFFLFLPFYLIKIIKKSTYLFIFAGAFFTIFFIANTTAIEEYTTRLSWAFEEISELLNGNKIGTFFVLQEMISIPSTLNGLLFGMGVDVFGENSPYGFSSDIGPIRDIFLFGLLNTILLSICLIYLFLKSLSIFKNKFDVIFSSLVVMSCILFYIKGAILSASEIFNCLLLFPVFHEYRKISSPSISSGKC